MLSANGGFSAIQQRSDENIKTANAVKMASYATITLYLNEGMGCACKPIVNESIYAEGLDTDHQTSGYTDADGFCILELEFDATYRIFLDIEPFQKIIFDVVIVDDQTFSFYMQLEDDSVSQQFNGSSLQQTYAHLKN